MQAKPAKRTGGAIREAVKFVARHAGTVLPLLVALVFWWAAKEYASGSFTWERVILYSSAITALAFGFAALVKLAHRPRREHPSVLMVTFIYEKATIMLTFLAVLFVALGVLFPGLPALPEWIIFGLLGSTAASLVINNTILYLGGRMGFFDEPCDPVPFRQAVRFLRRRR